MKLKDFIGEWTCTEYVKSDQNEDFKINNTDPSLISFKTKVIPVDIPKKKLNTLSYI